MRKFQSHFLTQTKTSISLELPKVLITLTYEKSLATSQKEDNHTFPHQMETQQWKKCNIQGINQGYIEHGGFGRSGLRRGSFRHGRGGSGGQEIPRKTITDITFITLMDG